MKLVALIALGLVCSTSFGAQLIRCSDSENHQLTLVRTAQDSFTLNMEKALSSTYVGKVVGRAMAQEPCDRADVLISWLGDSGIKLVVEKGFLSEDPGATSRGGVGVVYNDPIDSDHVLYHLTCQVLK